MSVKKQIRDMMRDVLYQIKESDKGYRIKMEHIDSGYDLMQGSIELDSSRSNRLDPYVRLVVFYNEDDSIDHWEIESDWEWEDDGYGSYDMRSGPHGYDLADAIPHIKSRLDNIYKREMKAIRKERKRVADLKADWYD